MNYNDLTVKSIAQYCAEKSGFKINKADLESQIQHLINIEKAKQLTLTDVVSSAFLVQHKETLINYGLFSTREKAENYINKNTDLFGIQEVKIA